MEYKPLDYQMDNSNGLVGSSVNYFKGLSKKVIGAVTVAGIAGIVAVGVLSSGGSNSPITGTNPVVVDTPTPYSTIENIITPTPLATSTPEPTPTPDLKALAYNAGKGSPEQAAQAYKDIMSYYDSTQDSEGARAQLERLVIGIHDSEKGFFDAEKHAALDIACFEKKKGPASQENIKRTLIEKLDWVERNKDEPAHFYIQPGVRRWEQCFY